MDDVFSDTTYGKLALHNLAPVGPNFRLYEAGWLGKGNERNCMEVKGADFREALRGPRKGQLCILVKGTERTAYITARDIAAYDVAHSALSKIGKDGA
jgi:hypothetical protein